MAEGQFCGLQKKQVSRGECHKCNAYFKDYGVYPFILCFSGHAFTPYEALTKGPDVFCPVCKQHVIPAAPTGGHFCCDHVLCKDNCDWFGNPNKCNLARDPQDASRLYPKQYEIMQPESQSHLEPLVDPNLFAGQLRTINVDGYLMAMHQISNQEVLRISEPDLKKAGKALSGAWSAMKILHRGNADQICKDIQKAYNDTLRDYYSRVKVTIKFGFKGPRPNIDISAGNSVTAWLLHELVPYVDKF